MNIGNAHEMSVLEITQTIIEISGSESELVHETSLEDDPKRRCPDRTRAKAVLDWEPRVPVGGGLKNTLEWFSGRVGEVF